ncbi:MAG: arylsulfatase [Oscillospiraceae bacterium]|jgi:arylsulfatase A-like enzyme|nr:arylsulfatase [Oscillospiraceae bacterium]
MARSRHNVIIIYADDLGYGDLSCYGGKKIPTPNLERLCETGIRFTNTYSTSAVCTPSRYSILTGRYPFRNDQAHILPGNAACIIDPKLDTMPKAFQRAGYRTGIVGKWHLGLGDGSAPVDWNQEIGITPLDMGFDESFIFPATADRVPCVYLDGRKVVNLDPNDPIEVSYASECPFDDIPTYQKNPELLQMESSHGHNMSIVNGIGRIGYMRGGEKALWKDEDLAETFLGRAVQFVTDSQKDGRPFFLYYALHQPHVPRVPAARFRGVTGMGPRGDVIAEMDWCVGQLLDKLEELGLRDDTMIIFSSDNGPVLDDGYRDQARELNGTHRPAGPLRGGKYSKYDGGTRIPFIVSYPKMAHRGVSEALVSQVDLFASFAGMLEVPLDDNAAVDSQDMYAALIGDDPNGRDELMAEDIGCGKLLRRGSWAYLSPSEGAPYLPYTSTETGVSRDPMLFNMDYDIGQRDNIAWDFPDVVQDMEARIQKIMASPKNR